MIDITPDMLNGIGIGIFATLFIVGWTLVVKHWMGL